MADPIRVIIADDHTIVRSGVRLLLDAEEDFLVIGEARDGHEAVSLAVQLVPDVLLMDIAMGDMDGMEATRQIKAIRPEINVLVLTMHRSDTYFFEMLKAGASGYVLKGAHPSELVQAVRVVGRGEVYLYPTVASQLVRQYLEKTQINTEHSLSISPREKEILNLLAAGYSSKEIAEKLVISQSTVHTHRTNLMTKLGLNSRRELIQYARDHGLVNDPL
jgi:two-component system, NarL family, response regulator NreC